MPDSQGYLGSKAGDGVFQAIIAAMPAHDIYIETHLGGGAVMKAKPAAAKSIGLDLDQAALDRFGCSYPVELHRVDCVDFLEGFDFGQGSGRLRTLIYADPPYVHATRTSRHRYRFEYDDDEHRRLIDTLKRVPADVILSGYPSDLYDELLDWRTIEFQAMTRGGPRTEKLWLNFDRNSAHWATFAGRGFTDRQRIKRKAQRWQESYTALPPGERLAILAALLEAEERIGEAGR